MRPERLRELSLLAVLAVAILIFSLLIDNYLGGSFFNRVTTSVAITAILAAGQTIVILTRNIDLSVGSIVGVTAYVTGEYLHDHPELTPVLAVAYAVAIGGGLGLLNGALVAYARVPSIIVTLGTLAIFRTWLINHSDSRTITSDGLPDWVLDLPNSTLVSFGEWDVRTVVLGAVVLIVVLQLLLGGLKWGRWVYAVGSNPDAARQAALPVERVILAAFVASGALAGLAGFLFLSRFGTITVNAGNGLELASVAAAVVGGVNIFGGSGTLIGALLGALLINLLDLSLLRVPGLSEFWRDAVLGTLILTAVAVDFLLGKRIGRITSRAGGRQTRPPRGCPMLDKAIKWRWELFLAVVLVVVFFVNVSISEFYLGEQNFVNMFQLSIEKLIVVVVMAFVIINGEIDLSVASVMAFSACVLAALHEAGSVPFGLAVVIALLAATAAGAIQGAFVAFMGLPSLVVTLAGLIGWRGAGRILVEDRSIGDFPEWFENLGQEPVIGRVSLAVVFFVIQLILAGIILHRTAFGRSVFVIGNNASVARYSGVTWRATR